MANPQFRTTTSAPPISSTGNCQFHTTTSAPPGFNSTDDGKMEGFLNYDGYTEPGEKPNEESNEGWLMVATIVAVIFCSGALLCVVIFLARVFGLISLLRRL